MSEQNSTSDGEADPHHSMSMLFLLVLVFFIMGLVGFLICHVLKKKGYRCRTFRDDLDLEHEKGLTELQANEEEELNEDTVEKIVRCIIQNEANAEALQEMLGDGDREVPVPVPVPALSLCPHRNSQDGGRPHHHTVHLGSTQAPCIHCSKRKRPPLHRQGRSKDGKGKLHPGETTVFSVGRFHVTHIEKRPTLPDQKGASLPEGTKEAGAWDPAPCSNEQLHQEGLHKGTIRKESCPNGTSPGEDAPTASAKVDAPSKGSAGKGLGQTEPLQEAAHRDLAPGNTSDQSQGPGAQGVAAPSDSQKEVVPAEPGGALLEEAGPGAAKERADVTGSQGVQAGTQAAVARDQDAGRKEPQVADKRQQEQRSAARDPGVTTA